MTDANKQFRNMEYVYLANFTGCPAISCPVGYDVPEGNEADGKVPTGFMGMGEWGSEDELIAFGYECERFLNCGEVDGGRYGPGNHEDVLELAEKGK